MAAIRNLPHRAYDRRPLIWGSPPAANAAGGSIIAPPASAREESADGKVRDINIALSSLTFSAIYAGAAAGTFPSFTRIASMQFAVPVGVASVVLSTSLVNATADGILAVVVAKNVGTTLDVANSSDVYVDHLVEQGLSHSMRSGMVFSDDVAPKFGSNEGFGIYVASAGTGFANNRAVAMATIRYFNLV